MFPSSALMIPPHPATIAKYLECLLQSKEVTTARLIATLLIFLRDHSFTECAKFSEKLKFHFLLNFASTLYVAYALHDGFCFLSSYSGSYKEESLNVTSVLCISFTEFVKYNCGF